MLLEYAQRRFERMEHRLSNLQGVANIQRVLEDYALASDVSLHFGNVTVGLGKMAANHRSKDTGIPDCEKSKPRLGRCTSPKRSYGAGRPLRRSGPAHFGGYRRFGCISRRSNMPRLRPRLL